jgi:hypothetical protein
MNGQWLIEHANAIVIIIRGATRVIILTVNYYSDFLLGIKIIYYNSYHIIALSII